MESSIVRFIASYCQLTHERTLGLVCGLDELQMMHQPASTAPPIAFHVWHLARWADYTQHRLRQDAGQIWEQEALGAKWELGEPDLGYADTGMGMADDVLASLSFPEKGILVDYARRAFAEAEQALLAVRDEQIRSVTESGHRADWRSSLADGVLEYLVHANRHLGMIECMVGLQGRQGSASD